MLLRDRSQDSLSDRTDHHTSGQRHKRGLDGTRVQGGNSTLQVELRQTGVKIPSEEKQPFIHRGAETTQSWQECVLITDLYFCLILQTCSEAVPPLTKA